MSKHDLNHPSGTFDQDFEGFDFDLNPHFPSHLLYGEQNLEILRSQVIKLTTGTSAIFTQTGLFEAAGVSWPKQQISNWINGQYKRKQPNDREFRALCEFIERERLWDTQSSARKAVSHPDTFYHAAVDFFGVRHGTEINVVDRALGLFKIYQPSLLFKDRFVVGMVRIWYSRASKAVKVHEHQFYDGQGKSRNMEEIYEGYMYRKSKRYFIIQRDKSRNYSKFVILPNWWRTESRIDFFAGVIMGLHGSRVYTLRVYLERFDGSIENLREEIGVKERRDIPENILYSLEMPFANGVAGFF